MAKNESARKWVFTKIERKLYMKVQDSNLRENVKTISNNFDTEIKKIMSIEYHYNLFNMFSSIDQLPEVEQNNTYEILINEYLTKLEKFDYEEIKKLDRVTDDVLEFFDYNYFISNDEKEIKDRYQIIEEEADEVAYDLIAKVLNKNDRKLELPISIDNIKKYCIHNIIKEDEIKKVILWIILDLATIYNVVSNK